MGRLAGRGQRRTPMGSGGPAGAGSGVASPTRSSRRRPCSSCSPPGRRRTCRDTSRTGQGHRRARPERRYHALRRGLAKQGRLVGCGAGARLTSLSHMWPLVHGCAAP